MQHGMLFDHLVGVGKKRRRHVEAERLRHDQVTTRSNLVGCSTGRSAGFAPAKSCRPSRRRAAEVDEGHRADGGRGFLFFVADVPDADYLARCVLDRVITGHVRFAEDVNFAVESLTFVDIHYRWPVRVKPGKSRSEQMFSGLPPTADTDGVGKPTALAFRSCGKVLADGRCRDAARAAC